jgi:hypothetical protein
MSAAFPLLLVTLPGTDALLPAPRVPLSSFHMLEFSMRSL